jgi:hypothetical protein
MNKYLKNVFLLFGALGLLFVADSMGAMNEKKMPVKNCTQVEDESLPRNSVIKTCFIIQVVAKTNNKKELYTLKPLSEQDKKKFSCTEVLETVQTEALNVGREAFKTNLQILQKKAMALEKLEKQKKINYTELMAYVKKLVARNIIAESLHKEMVKYNNQDLVIDTCKEILNNQILATNVKLTQLADDPLQGPLYLYIRQTLEQLGGIKLPKNVLKKFFQDKDLNNFFIRLTKYCLEVLSKESPEDTLTFNETSDMNTLAKHILNKKTTI